MIHKLSSCLLVLSFLFLSSCKKIILETVPVIMYTDISIPNAGDIKHFSFPDNEVGYAASDTNFIYKTINGGKTWNAITNSNWSILKKCQGLVFFDALKGFCLIGGAAYSTKDGGVTWTVSNPWYGGNAPVVFCGMTSSGIGIIGRAESYGSVKLYNSTDKGQTFYLFDQMNLLGRNLRGGSVSGDFIAAFTTIDNYMFGLSYSTSNYLQFDLRGELKDFYSRGGISGIGVGTDGYLTDVSGAYLNATMDLHRYDYNSVDGKNGLIMAVGDKTIVSNLDIGSEEEWSDVLDLHGNGFTQKFFEIRFTGDREFYISGESGLIWKATI